MYIIVAYDIRSNRKRAKLAKNLLQFGIRTQKSMFECEVNKKELNIIKKLAKKFSDDEDFVTVYEIYEKDTKRIGNVKYLEIDDLIF